MYNKKLNLKQKLIINANEYFLKLIFFIIPFKIFTFIIIIKYDIDNLKKIRLTYISKIIQINTKQRPYSENLYIFKI